MTRILGYLLLIGGSLYLGYLLVGQFIVAPMALGNAQEEALTLPSERLFANQRAVGLDEVLTEGSAVGIATTDDPSTIETSEDMFDFSIIQSLDTLSFSYNPSLETVIATISAPSVGMHLPIYYGTTNEHLAVGAATMKPDQRLGVEGTYALAGHNSRNSSALFAPIRSLEDGAEIIISDGRDTYIYRKFASEVVTPDRVDVINDRPGNSLLALVSCYSADGSDRIIVYAEFVEKVEG
ncbi:class A sortase [Paenalkalicoccus suaedae]|uniref:Class A sortase n=1 Tax=Paenalkalicoccus suaedae TaxID=2592382 RepID=A0A859FHP8_9BACI|nr:class A sortase [Paenalkalicoccus suaedae]QKS72619.1 class A sortase [Paenalkalicoccus suaedae]